MERFGFEMKKRYDQTELQLLLSPSVLLVTDNLNRPSKDKHLSQGKLTLSSLQVYKKNQFFQNFIVIICFLQVRGHAMFSDVGRSLDQDTIEYAWLIEVQMGRLSGKLTTPQLFTVLSSLETLILLISDSENELNSTKDDVLLSQPQMQQTVPPTQNLPQHVQQAIQQLLQPKNSSANPPKGGVQGGNSSGNQKNVQNMDKTKSNERKRSEENNKKVLRQNSTLNHNEEDSHALKYKMTRVAVDAIDFWLVESGAALQLWVSPIRLANCNLHGKQVTSGLSCMIYSMCLRQTVWQPHKYNHSK